MNKKTIDLLYVALIIALILFMIFAVVFMRSNAKECLEDPIKFFEIKNEGAICNCYKDGVGYGVGVVNYSYDPKP